MNPKEAFKIGFLEKCAADGLSNEETLQRIQHAKFMLKSAQGDKNPWETVSRYINFPLSWGKRLALFGPPLAGIAGGYGLAQLRNDEYATDDAKQEEELAEYHRAISRLKALQARQNVV